MRDPEALLHFRPKLAPPDAQLDIYRDLLADAYYDYTENVSFAQMAISLRTSAFILWLCLQLDAESVCDFGSGFTSYVLREYARAALVDVTVMSVDDSPEWLDRTAGWLEGRGHDNDGLFLWTEPLVLPVFDVVVYDFASGETRERWMDYALQHTGAACVFDDAMHDSHRTQMETSARAQDMRLCSLELWTRDQFGRYAALAFR